MNIIFFDLLICHNLTKKQKKKHLINELPHIGMKNFLYIAICVIPHFALYSSYLIKEDR
jgi:hypothetical protein